MNGTATGRKPPDSRYVPSLLIAPGGGIVDRNKSFTGSTDWGSEAVYVQNVGHVSIDGVTIKNAQGPNILAEGTNYLTIRNCYLTGINYAGLFVYPTATSGDISHVAILNNIIEIVNATDHGGIHIRGKVDGATYKLKSSVVSGNRIIMPIGGSPSISQIGIETFTAVESTIIEGNEILGGNMGVSLDMAANCSVANNAIISTKSIGIELPGTVRCSVSGNIITGSQSYGIQASVAVTTKYNIIRGNSIYGSTMKGIHWSNAGNYVTISDNFIFMGGAAYAIDLGLCNHFTITGNVLEGNSQGTTGIFLDRSHKGTITGNVIGNFTQNGIQLYSASADTLSHLVISGNYFTNTINTSMLSTNLSGGAVLDDTVMWMNNVSTNFDFVINAHNLLRNVKTFVGISSPEGLVTAGVGSIFIRYDGGTGTTLYIKESGTGNTGWAAK